MTDEVYCHHCGEPMPAFSPEVFAAYLKHKEWLDQGKTGDGKWHRFSKQFAVHTETHDVELEVPLLVDARDYDRCCGVVIINLHRLESRPASEVVKDLNLVAWKLFQ